MESLSYKSRVREYLNEHDMFLGDGTVVELDRAIMAVLDVAIRAARNDSRRTVRPSDVRGDQKTLF